MRVQSLRLHCIHGAASCQRNGDDFWRVGWHVNSTNEVAHDIAWQALPTHTRSGFQNRWEPRQKRLDMGLPLLRMVKMQTRNTIELFWRCASSRGSVNIYGHRFPLLPAANPCWPGCCSMLLIQLSVSSSCIHTTEVSSSGRVGASAPTQDFEWGCTCGDCM